MSGTPASSRIRSLLRRPAVVLLLALLSVAALVSLLGRLAGGGEGSLKRVQLSDEAGSEMYGSFSPDGARIAYSGRAAGKGDTFHVYVRPATGGAARQLTAGEASDIGPAWSPDGKRIAFARLAEDRTEYVVAPAGGGDAAAAAATGSTEITQQAPAVAWMRDGLTLVAVLRPAKQPAHLALIPAAGGAPKKLTSPPEGSEGDVAPAVSPDGQWIAFVRRPIPDGGDIWVCDTSGGSLRQVTYDNNPIRGLAWTADGREVVYSSNRMHDRALWRVSSSGGSPRRIIDAGSQAHFPAIAPKGHRLLWADSPSKAALWRADVADPSKEKPIVRSQGRDSAPSFSFDGKRIAFRSDRTGYDEIWTADANGDNPHQATEMKPARMGRPRWSPDGKTLVFAASTGHDADLYSVPSSGGKALRLTNSRSSAPAFSPDGKWIYSGQSQIWRRTPDGGAPMQITKNGGANASPSPDGKWIYYQRGREIRRVPPEGGEEEELYRPDHSLFWAALTAVKDGVYFLEWKERRRGLQLSFFDVKQRKARPVMDIERADLDRGASFDISPDGKTVIYSKVDQAETDLILLEGFR